MLGTQLNSIKSKEVKVISELRQRKYKASKSDGFTAAWLNRYELHGNEE